MYSGNYNYPPPPSRYDPPHSLTVPWDTSVSANIPNASKTTFPPASGLISSLLSGDGAEVKKCAQMITDQLPSLNGELDYIVTKLENVKTKGTSSEHEDVIATVAHTQTGHTQRISFGRFKGHVMDKAAGKKPFPFSFASLEPSVNTSSNPSSSKSSTTSNAKDVARTLRKEEVTPPSVLVFEPTPGSLSLLHLILIAQEVHELAPEYSLFKRQCYWFAMMVMAISMLQGGKAHTATYKDRKKEDFVWKTSMVPQFPVAVDQEGNISKILDLPYEPLPDKKDLSTILPVLKAEAGKFHAVRVIRKLDASRIWSSMEEARGRYQSLHICDTPEVDSLTHTRSP
ncbi:hypothetical protein BDN70DRAFT_984776 [Pholiota conissans]|uniref:Uncharacterized protein n=1 Tax=Pholiota conissans TaxID=109636 RepID=A0A9P5ZCQ5_9AGAR|nr:hypothetical protein BDN70DRAFT_984776 [Pholiota conissans]